MDLVLEMHHSTLLPLPICIGVYHHLWVLLRTIMDTISDATCPRDCILRHRSTFYLFMAMIIFMTWIHRVLIHGHDLSSYYMNLQCIVFASMLFSPFVEYGYAYIRDIYIWILGWWLIVGTLWHLSLHFLSFWYYYCKLFQPLVSLMTSHFRGQLL